MWKEINHTVIRHGRGKVIKQVNYFDCRAQKISGNGWSINTVILPTCWMEYGGYPDLLVVQTAP